MLASQDKAIEEEALAPSSCPPVEVAFSCEGSASPLCEATPSSTEGGREGGRSMGDTKKGLASSLVKLTPLF